MDFNELMALARNPGDDGLPDTFYDDVESSHNLAVDGATAKIAELETSGAALSAEIASLKALNFDLLMAAGSETSATEESTDTPTADDAPSIESLFSKD